MQVISAVLSADRVGKDGPDFRLKDEAEILLIYSVFSCDQVEKEIMKCISFFSRIQW